MLLKLAKNKNVAARYNSNPIENVYKKTYIEYTLLLQYVI